MKLLVGLGNPGSKYDATRHNVGFWWCDQLASTLAAQFERQSKFYGDIARTKVDDADVWLLKPQTFMNESGRSVQSMCSFYGIEVSDILVVHDDLDLEPGVVKLKQGGGHGGHNGIRDIGLHLGLNFWRLRIGVGHPGDKRLVSSYVLHAPKRAEEDLIDEAIRRSLDVKSEIMTGMMSQAMLVLHTSNTKP
ncbi:MAG: aminoacyl-tRNA hydrolase [Burkholderiales bacterium]|nr:aminoacyl-tRNA hydrolase [Burkholderiales bacterium]OUT76027.1 MAG: aminoacyl-tRNA hydrolase [Betaproteobacteria bacterium TMED22]|tara:strand:- start:148 stop:723 length:576 start_codon:yes stop_codon:yes gene_type:complete